MARLAPEVLDEARNLIRNKDLEGLLAWLSTKAPGSVDENVFRDMYSKIFSAEDVGKGLAVFNAVFPTYDPVETKVLRVATLLVYAVVGLGLAGGVLYLVRTAFGH